MINQELARLEQEIEGSSVPQLKVSDAFDTQAYLRLRFPSLPYNLDAACKHYHIETSHRVIHGALLDSRLTAKLALKLLRLESHETQAKATNRFFRNDRKRLPENTRKRQFR